VVEADIVVVSTGYDTTGPTNALLGNPKEVFGGLFAPTESSAKENKIQFRVISMANESNRTVPFGQQNETTAIAFQVEGKANTEIFLYGAGAGLPVSASELNTSLTGSPDSINILGPKSAAIGRVLGN
ncbi:hypothetical protein N9D31_03945, partial [Oligoflexaceae bacterium]|nr:hypothetical protein [Oligoflexaceae bacterium]